MVSDLWISDHCLVYAIRKINLPKSTPKIKTSRCFEKFDPLSFRNDLAMAPWYLVAAESDPTSYGVYGNKFLNTLLTVMLL